MDIKLFLIGFITALILSYIIYKIGWHRGFRNSGERLHEIAVLMWKENKSLANFITQLGNILGK